MRRLITICTLLFAATAIAEPIPMWKFFEPFDMQAVIISPEGTYLAASLLEGDGDEQENKLQVLDRVTGDRVISFGMPDKQRIASLQWTDDETLLVSPSRKVPNEEAYFPTGGLMKVIVKTGQTIDLFAQRERSGGIYHSLPEDPEHALLIHQSGRFSELYKLHLHSGAVSSKIARAPALGGGFVLTPDLQDVAFHIGGNDDAETLLHERTENGEWKLLRRTAFDQKGWLPIGAAFNPNEYFTRDSRNPRGIASLGIYNRVTGEHTEVYTDDTFDVGGLIADQTGNVWGVFINHHFPRTMYLNPTHPLAQAHKMIHRQFPESTVSISSYSFDHKLVIAQVSAANSLPELVMLDADKGSIEQITDRATEIGISPDDLAPMEPFYFAARDKTTIFGYLTSRKDTPRPGPMLVYVHGGPLNVRDSWGFNGRVQVLASRGYHVLQVNYRGSGGRGTEFVKAGFREYGGKMQDDVTDATLWAIEQGIANEDRICIGGSSYGAYAAIMGVAKEPDLYQCAIGQSGLYDPVLTLRIGDLARRVSQVKMIRQTMGRTQEEREAISVVNRAGDVKAAVMLIHGGQDRRTPPEHYHRMKEAFDNVGKQVVTHYRGNQGHSWFGRDTIMDLYGWQLSFLDEHIGGESEQVQAVSTTN